MAKSKPSKAEANKYSPNMWGMVQNVLINATNKGQIIAGFVGMIILIGILKMPPEDVSKLFFKTFDALKSLYALGWVLTFFVTVTSVIMFNRLRRMHKQEMKILIEHTQVESIEIDS